MKKLKIKNYKGYTLIELLIVVAIIGIMTIVSLIMLNNSKDRKDVESAAREVVAAIREAQNYAIGGKMVGNDVPCAYWIDYLNSTGFWIRYTPTDPVCNPSWKVDFTKYALRNNVQFEGSWNSFNYNAPFGRLLNSSMLPASSRYTITLRKGTTACASGGVCHYVCVCPDGNVYDQRTACPASCP